MRFWADTRERHRFLQHDKDKPILPPEEIFLRSEDFFARANAHATLSCAAPSRSIGRGHCPTWSVDPAAPEPLARLQPPVQGTPHRVLIVAESEGRRESLLELLRDNKIEPPSVASLAEFESGAEHFAIGVAPLAEGFFWHEPGAGGRSSSSPRRSCSPAAPSARRQAASRSRSATSTR